MKRLMHTEPGPMTFEVDLSAGEVEVVVEDREYAEVWLEPVHAGDEVAAELIEGSTHSCRGGVLDLRVPHPKPTAIGAGGAVIAGSVNNVTVFSGGNMTVVNGQVVGWSGTVGHVTTGGAVRVTARLPQCSAVSAATVSADLSTRNPVEGVRFRTKSGDLEVAECRLVKAQTVSGDVRVDEVGSVEVSTTSGDFTARSVEDFAVTSVSGDIRVQRWSGARADARSVSGDVDIHAAIDGPVAVSTVSGDIRLTAGDGVTVRPMTSTVTGRVRTPGGAR